FNYSVKLFARKGGGILHGEARQTIVHLNNNSFVTLHNICMRWWFWLWGRLIVQDKGRVYLRYRQFIGLGQRHRAKQSDYKAGEKTKTARHPAYIRGRVTPACPMYLPARSA